MGSYKSKLKTILWVYQNQIQTIEQEIAQVVLKRQHIIEKINYVEYKKQVVKHLIETGEPVDSSVFLNVSDYRYEQELEAQMKECEAQIYGLNQKRHGLTKKKDWIIDEDKKRESQHNRELLKKEERKCESDEEGEM